MKTQFKQIVHHITPINDDTLDKIFSHFILKTVKKNNVLLAEGETCKEFYFLMKGIVRTYYLTKQGQEKTRYILFDYSIGTSLASFISHQPSKEIVDTLEDCTLLCISHHNFYHLVEEIPEWKTFYLKIMEMAYIYQNKKIENRVTLSAKQRFDKVMTETPFYFQRLSNKVLASYLDITQETLSRLKSK